MVSLVIRNDGTYTYRTSGCTREQLPALLREVADQIEQNCDLPT